MSEIEFKLDEELKKLSEENPSNEIEEIGTIGEHIEIEKPESTDPNVGSEFVLK